MKDPIEIIREHIDQSEMLAQLAEEASELAHVALKLRRAYDGTNPTPVTRRQAYSQLLEEYGDIFACTIALGFNRGIDKMQIGKSAQEKLERWEERLTAKEENHDDGEA